MSTIDDLRATLETHAEDLADSTAALRTVEVHRRVAAVRRRRRATAAGVLAVALVAASITGLQLRGGSQPEPAAPVVLGQRAPATMASLGYTYVPTGQKWTVDGHATIHLDVSASPRLVSWTTDDGGAVVLSTGDDQTVHSRADHFGDFVFVAPGEPADLRVSVSRGRVGLAAYVLGGRPATGYTREGLIFRDTVAGVPLLGAAISAPGQTSAASTYVAPSGETELHVWCTGVPDGDVLHVSINGHDKADQSGACGAQSTFDVGADNSYSSRFGHAGQRLPVRIWVSTKDDDAALASGSVPGLQVAVGVYGPSDTQALGGWRVDRTVEYAGHTWSLSGAYDGSPHSVPPSDQDSVVIMVLNVHGNVTARLSIGGQSSGSHVTGPGGQSAFGPQWAPAGAAVHASIPPGAGTFGIAVYQRTD